jgi:UDP-2,3-diacylglucosamine hydrolase
MVDTSSNTQAPGTQYSVLSTPSHHQVTASTPHSALRAPLSIGLIAGWGRFPIAIAESLKAQGCEVHCVGLKGHADEQLGAICDSYYLSAVARLGAHIRFFQRRGVKQATLAGKLFKDRVLYGQSWLSLLPDLRTIKAYFPHFVLGSKNRNDDTLLGVIVSEYAKSGITMAPATEFAPQLLAREGVLTSRGPSAVELRDIHYGWNLAKEMGRLDIGQSVVVKGQAVVAVEAIEGTDACIRRAAQLCNGVFTVVKVAKPQQDMRFDVPTVGRNTIESIIAARGSALAIEAGKTILLDEDEVVALADRHGIAIISLAGSPE